LEFEVGFSEPDLGFVNPADSGCPERELVVVSDGADGEDELKLRKEAGVGRGVGYPEGFVFPAEGG